MSHAHTGPVSSIARVGWVAFGLLHLACGLAWLTAMAGGFPLLHRMSLANRGIPSVLVVLGAGVIVAAAKGPARWARRGVLALLGVWLGGGVAAWLVFPASAGPAWVLPGLAGLAIAWRAHGGTLRGLVAVVPGALCGVAMVWSQRSPAPGTRPLGGTVPRPVDGDDCRWDGRVDFSMGERVHVQASALPTFQSVSPDRSWTVLAPGMSWRGLVPRCLGQRTLDDHGGEVGAEAWFRAEGEAWLRARAGETGSWMTLDVAYELEEPIYSHLNHFFVASITGPDPTVVFSPCPEHVVEPLSTMGPGHFAYLDSRGEFVLARTASMEKGPFEELCRTPPPEEGRIEFIVRQGGTPVGRIVLRDWAAQADLSPSPTAGWGVAANAIELWRLSPDALRLSVTLSATSIGRGWHSVGHSAGTYRSRVELLAIEHDEIAPGAAGSRAPRGDEPAEAQGQLEHGAMGS